MEEIREIYQEVFNPDGTVKNCGKEKCLELILAMSDRFKRVDFGNKKTGMMNIEEIQRAYNMLSNSHSLQNDV